MEPGFYIFKNSKEKYKGIGRVYLDEDEGFQIDALIWKKGQENESSSFRMECSVEELEADPNWFANEVTN